MDYVTTVRGPVPADTLGLTLTHEHVFSNLLCYLKPTTAEERWRNQPLSLETLALHRRDLLAGVDNLVLDDIEVAVAEISEFGRLGGGTIVDVTVPDIGRSNPQRLRAVSEATGVQIIASCGHYVHVAQPKGLGSESVESISERFIREIDEGIQDTDIRVGMIGEIGTSNPVHPVEARVLRAAARAQCATGIPITVHLSPPGARMGHNVLDILESEGGDLDRVVLSHVDNHLSDLESTFETALQYHKTLASRGAFLGYDGCGKTHYFPSGVSHLPAFYSPSDCDRARAIARLVEDGYGSKILLAHDICFKVELQRYGGLGYGHVLRTFVGTLRDFGVDESDIERMLVDNPRTMLVPQ